LFDNFSYWKKLKYSLQKIVDNAAVCPCTGNFGYLVFCIGSEKSSHGGTEEMETTT